MNRLIIALLTVMLVGGISGCNTTEGVGKDVEAAGEEIQETARDVKDEITDND